MCSAAWMASTNPTARRRRITARRAGCSAIAATARSRMSRRRAGSSIRTSKSLGVALLDYDHDGWPDLLIANDTQPNKLYRNLRDGTFEDVARARGRGVQRRRQGARRAWAWTWRISRTPARTGIAITNFDNEMIALYRPDATGGYADVAVKARASAGLRGRASGSAALSWTPIWTGIWTCWP